MLKYFISNPKPIQSGYEFKMRHSFDKRKSESDALKAKYNKIPIIIEVDKKSAPKLPSLNKSKFLIDRNISIGQLLLKLREKTKIDSSQAIFLFVDYTNGVNIPSTGDKIGDLYDKYSDKDGFLYITYSAQQTFGC